MNDKPKNQPIFDGKGFITEGNQLITNTKTHNNVHEFHVQAEKKISVKTENELPPSEFISNDLNNKQMTVSQRIENKPISSSRSIASANYRQLSLLEATILLVKASIGLGVFSNGYGFAKVGYVLGSIICIIMCYITCYAEYTMVKLANTIEKENEDKDLHIFTYYETAMACVKKKYKLPVKIISAINIMLINLATPVA